jgi:hypothetical protein
MKDLCKENVTSKMVFDLTDAFERVRLASLFVEHNCLSHVKPSDLPELFRKRAITYEIEGSLPLTEILDKFGKWTGAYTEIKQQLIKAGVL